MRALVWMSLVLQLGCADDAVKPEEKADVDQDADSDADSDADGGAGGEECDTDIGTLAGQVMNDFGWSESAPTPAPGARISATPVGSEAIAIIADGNGQFTAELPSGAYSISATLDGCFSDTITIVLDPCETEIHLLNLIDCIDGGGDDDADGGGDGDADADGGIDSGSSTDVDADLTARVCDPTHFAPYVVDDLAFESGVLSVTVSYSGGCMTHTWDACWSGTWLHGTPPKAVLNLSHNASSDSCTLWETETMTVNIQSLIDSAEATYPDEAFTILAGARDVRIPPPR